MDWLNGLSDCWLLGSTCSLNWEAWSAIGSLAAVLLALGIALSRYRKVHNDALRRARAMAEPLCDELRAIHWRLERLENLPPPDDVARAWLEYTTRISGLITPVFDRFAADVHSFDGETAAHVFAAYGALIRTRELLTRKQPGRVLDRATAPLFVRFLAGVPTIVVPVRSRVRSAAYALWKYTPHQGRDPFEDAHGDE